MSLPSPKNSASPAATPSKEVTLDPVHVEPTITVPVPETRQELELLLAQYLAYRNQDEKLDEKSQVIRDKIEDVLYEISTKQGKILKLQEQFENSTVDKNVDLSLLRKQILGLQLLSHDLNLPETLQEAFLEGVEVEKDENLTPPFVIDEEDYASKLKLLGVKQNRNLHPKTADSVGNAEVEDVLSMKISNRISQLESISANLGSYDLHNISNALLSSDKLPHGIDDLKLKALIELKSLNLLPKQKYHRQKIAEAIYQRAHLDVDFLKKNPLTMAAQRALRVKPKVFAVQTSRLAEQLEEQQKAEKTKKETRAHSQKVQKIVDFADEFLNSKEDSFIKKSNFGRSLTLLHQKIEKEESKKLESTAKARLQALKANDEEAYLKLLDQTKDTRITHLLKQTNQFLDSLANAVKAQQNEAKTKEEIVNEETADEEREKIDYYEVAHRIKEEVVKQPTILVGGTLKEYQIKGLQWMVSLYNNHLNGILADEMGLGKTIQSISLITYLLEFKKETGKFLVIVPLSTITNWTLEFEKWAPSVNTIVYKGSPGVRKQLQHDIRIGNFTVLLTTYEYVIKDRPLLAKFRWAHMIIDEGHRMKNSKSKLSYTLTHYYHTKNRLILTGTPLQNNLPELWALLNFVLPKIFNSVKSFDEWFNTPFANTGSQDKMELTEEESLLVIRRLHKVLRPFLLRRLKKDVEKDLPDKVEKVVKCKLSALQYSLYQQMLKHNAFFIGQGADGATKTGIKGLNNKIMQLRKVCNHPFVFEEVENVINPQRITNDIIWRCSGKFELLDRILPKFKASGHRVLIFFQMTQVMDIMEDYLRYKDMSYLRLDGATKADDRQDMLKLFNAPNSEYFAFLLSTRAGGLGLNLQTADTVIIFDTDWNPHQDLQAQDRAHRIGQKNEVRILRLITNDSVEEVILERAHQKLDIDGKVIQAGKFDNKSTAQEQEEFLKRLLEAEAEKTKDDEEDDELEDEALNEILARSEDEKVLFAKMDDDRVSEWNKESKKQGKTVPIPRLLQDDELPSVFSEDITIHLQQPTTELGRTREKKRVYYDDGLTEEQWLEAVDNDDDSIEAAIARKRQRVEKRRVTAQSRIRDDSEELETIQSPSPAPSTPARGSRRGRSRSAKVDSEDSSEEIDNDNDDDADVDVDDDDEEYPQYITQALQLVEELNELNDDNDGHNLAGIFQALPSRKLYPDYYKVIEKPISLSVITKNLKKVNYENATEFFEDLDTMLKNAKTYNEEGSVIYNDAEVLEKYITEHKFE